MRRNAFDYCGNHHFEDDDIDEDNDDDYLTNEPDQYDQPESEQDHLCPV